jgi:osmotically-inducible protein OsmY
MSERTPKRAPYPPPGSADPHEERRGETAEDDEGVGHGEEGFVASVYPGHHPLDEESEEEHAERVAEAWEGPHTLADDDVTFEPLAPGEADRIHRTLCERLERLGRSCRDVRVDLRARTVVLKGEVADGDAKQEIERVCSTIPGVEQVVSRLEIAG